MGLSVYLSYLPCGSYLVFKYIAPIVQSCWSFNIPPVLRGIPSDFSPTHEVVIELNQIILRWSCGDVNEIPRASSDCPPPGCFEIYKRYVSSSSFFD